MEQEQKMKNESTQRSLQDYLSLGYLYLLVLGIFKDAIYYGFLGVNIINYSNVQDILLSPIIFLTSDLKRLAIILIVIPGFCALIGYSIKWYHNKNKDKDAYKATKHYKQWEKLFAEGKIYGFLIVLIFYMLFGGFIGFGIGRGQKISEKLGKGTLKNDHQITFFDDQKLKVNLIGHNSEYLFYVAEKDTVITIVPIQGNIKKIQNLE